MTAEPEYSTRPLLDVPDGGPVDDPGFVARQILPSSNAWGGTAAQQAHLEGSCVPAGCRYCAAAEAAKAPGEETT